MNQNVRLSIAHPQFMVGSLEAEMIASYLNLKKSITTKHSQDDVNQFLLKESQNFKAV